jgi:glycosyltransferase involved in cell wall biosynthesis
LIKRKIDIVVPVRNEQTGIPLFVNAVNRLAIPESISIGILFVEDSSTDNTVQTLRDVAAKSGNVSYYILETGFGEGPAVAFGMSRSTADAVITMESGGGHPVESIPELISHYLAGAEIIQAVRLFLTNRKWYRSVGTAFFNIFLRLLTGFDAKRQNVYFRLLSKRQKDLLIRKKMFVATLRFRLSETHHCRIDQVYFHAKDRISGKSEYNFARLVKVSLDFVFAMIPMTRLCFLLLFLFILGLLLILYVSPWSAVVVMFCMIVVAMKSWTLRNNKTLKKIKVTERHVRN